MENILNIALVQTSLAWEQSNENLKKFEEQIQKLSNKIDLIVLPEMFSTGFTMNAQAFAEEPEGRTFKWMQKMAGKSGAAITGSIIVKYKDNFFNRLYFVDPSGTYYFYDKRHTFTLAGEDKIYSSGEKKLLIDYKGWKICPLICYDLRFPVWSRNTEDYDLLIYVANWPKRRVVAWDSLLKARAIENMSYCIGVNRTGTDGNDVEYPGHSMVYDGLGKELLNFEKDADQTLITKLEKEHLEKIRGSFKFLQDRDAFILK